MNRTLFLSLLALCVLLTACDSTGPESTPEPHFELTAGAPVNASVQGQATLGNNLSFDEQNVFVHPIQPLDKTVTIVQLSGEYEESVTHDLSFMRLADGPLEPGTYEVGMNGHCDSSCGPGFFPDELFTVSYGRQTADSLHFYPLKEGTVAVETATDEVVEGTFSLDAAMEASVSRADMEAFRDSLREGPPSDSTEFPRPPEPTVTALEPLMTIEGSFTATPGTLSDAVTRPQWSVSGDILAP
ncbi:MAG: hypothetical protein V5A20_10800 [Salinibacter sp.]|uniref:hypothetical protein n=1 Tax=Salinibacter sp. TaxID=2065818 RepID=UPI002FC29771